MAKLICSRCSPARLGLGGALFASPTSPPLSAAVPRNAPDSGDGSAPGKQRVQPLAIEADHGCYEAGPEAH